MLDKIIKDGIANIDKEVVLENNIEEQSKLIVKDMLSNKSLSTFTYINDNMFLMTLSYKIDEDSKMIKEYTLTASNIMKAYGVSSGNIDILDKIKTFSAVDTSNNNVYIPPQVYRPYRFDLEVDKPEVLDYDSLGVNRVVYTAVSYLYGKLVVEELD